MLIHNWLRVPAGAFHDFHCSWITHLKESLNAGVLPPPFYAQSEQRAGEVIPDVLALEVESDDLDEPDTGTGPDPRLVAVAERPPDSRLHFETSGDLSVYAAKRRTLVIRHAGHDRIVAFIEIASPANRVGQGLRDFVDKAVAALSQGIHLLVVDLFPPTRRRPSGLHGAIWEAISDQEYIPPPDLPLTLASYRVNSTVEAFVEPAAPGGELPAMPLFLTPDRYVSVNLVQSYEKAWIGLPERWRRTFDGPAS